MDTWKKIFAMIIYRRILQKNYQTLYIPETTIYSYIFLLIIYFSFSLFHPTTVFIISVVHTFFFGQQYIPRAPQRRRVAVKANDYTYIRICHFVNFYQNENAKKKRKRKENHAFHANVDEKRVFNIYSQHESTCSLVVFVYDILLLYQFRAKSFQNFFK